MDNEVGKKPVACPVCHSGRLSPAAEYASFENHARFRGLGGQSWKGPKDVTVKPKLAIFCLDCGYTMLFIDAGDAAQLGSRFGR